MTDTQFLINHIEMLASHAHVWGFILVFVLMCIESSFLPFPSEVIMIPAGFLACRGELTFGVPILDLITIVVLGLCGSLAGSFFNYYFALFLGRPFLHKYAKYFFINPEVLDRAEELFRKYGDITTFVCRLIPAIRQLISLPAGISKMSVPRFALFTGLGAGIWSLILALVGFYFGTVSKDMSYADLVYKGKGMIADNYIWIFLALLLLVVIYIFVHKKVMHSSSKKVNF